MSEETWQLVILDINKASFFGQTTYFVNVKLRDFIKNYWPDYVLKSKADECDCLIMLLLRDGWEPYATGYAYNTEVLYFRRKG